MHANDYPFHYEHEVIFRHIDAFQHVNHAQYLTYMEASRVKMLMALSGVERPTLRVPVILLKVAVLYRAPAVLGDVLTLGMGVSRFGNTSFDIVYQIDRQDGTLVALAHTVITMFDYERGHTFPVPQEFRDRVHAIQGDWMPPEVFATEFGRR